MSELFKQILFLPAGGVAKLEVREYANIFSEYNLCSSVPVEELIASLTSISTLSISDVRIIASPPIAGVNLCTLNREVLIPTLASVYNLSTAVT